MRISRCRNDPRAVAVDGLGFGFRPCSGTVVRGKDRLSSKWVGKAGHGEAKAEREGHCKERNLRTLARKIRPLSAEILVDDGGHAQGVRESRRGTCA